MFFLTLYGDDFLQRMTSLCASDSDRNVSEVPQRTRQAVVVPRANHHHAVMLGASLHHDLNNDVIY